jgi:hypothetical protein
MNTSAMPLVFLPDIEAPFWWGAEPVPRVLAGEAARGERCIRQLLTPDGIQAVQGVALPLLDSLVTLAVLPRASLPELADSVAAWSMASKLAIELVARERVVPRLLGRGGQLEARWAAALASSEDADKLATLARCLPPAAHAVVVAPDAAEVWAPEALLRAFVDAAVDALVRSASGPAKRRRAGAGTPEGPPAAAWDQRWRAALEGPQPAFETHGFAERSVVGALERWSEPALGARDRLRTCFRLELPDAEREVFSLRFLLQSPDDPSLLLAASEIWQARGGAIERLGRGFVDAEESLLEALGRASLLFAPIGRALTQKWPELLELDPAEAWAFLGEGATALAAVGFGVIVPAELTARGSRRLRLRLRIGDKVKVAGAVSGSAALGLDELLAVDWQALIGDQALTASDLSELAELARRKAPLVRFRGAWVAVDRAELEAIRKRVRSGGSQLPLREALAAALEGETRHGSLPAEVAASGEFAELLGRLQQGAHTLELPPAGLRATLRPYQQRGQSWLGTMGSLGLGACLADDMGLGKTVQLLAHLLRRLERHPDDARPALLVAPTSVVGNWEREAERFAPALRVTRHYGPERAGQPSELPSLPGSLVLTTYGLLRRDAGLLAGVAWSTVALDEAQNIKNAASATARAARTLVADQRVALTGTPVENRLAELWSILDFTNPGLLGPLERFRREFAVPIERYGSDAAAQRLRRIVGPFVLRRLKTDPAVIDDLPPKLEMRVVCTLTREQASLYKAVVDEELRRIAEARGMERRGRVLALLTYTKQVCNHPAQYLSEPGPLGGRSGKLERLTAMLEEALAAGDKALVFTQYREMGERLVAHLELQLGCSLAFLHGGTPQAAREELVRRFQEDAQGPRVFVLSVKAGGTGLNLTAASHVFHYDRWWNPAVEDQATDRAYRIGQTRRVHVYKLICAGSVEEKIDILLEKKRSLATKVVGAGEQWITELDTGELRELFALAKDAVIEDGEAPSGEATSAPSVRGKRPPRARRTSARSRRQEPG